MSYGFPKISSIDKNLNPHASAFMRVHLASEPSNIYGVLVAHPESRGHVCVHTLLNATLGVWYVCAQYLNARCTQ